MYTLIEPGDIERRSFEIIEAEASGQHGFLEEEWLVVRRMIHTTADFELPSLARFHPDAIGEGIAALTKGCLIVTDTQMARMGITRTRMDRLGCTVACHMDVPAVRDKARQENITRASAAVDVALPLLGRGIYVVGNAPTALMRLLEWVERGACRPALIVGMPVGFVNAAESKEMLMAQKGIPYITIKGRKGGSALAACVVNQLAEMALERVNRGK
jgi:precorrin-8X/cobalt-precorrin-8 methylmutase